MILQSEFFIADIQGGFPVGDHDESDFAFEIIQHIAERIFGFSIQGTGRFIENEQLCIVI